jgi:hypothetical protein
VREPQGRSAGKKRANLSTSKRTFNMAEGPRFSKVQVRSANFEGVTSGFWWGNCCKRAACTDAVVRQGGARAFGALLALCGCAHNADALNATVLTQATYA